MSKNELRTVKKIVREGLDARILVLSRLKKEDIDAAIESEADLILLFIASSPLHLKYKLHMTEEEVKEGVIATRIAAHAVNLIRFRDEYEWDYEMLSLIHI